MDDQVRTPYDVGFEKLAFRVWLSGRSESNYSAARRNMMTAVREELTPVQHRYATALLCGPAQGVRDRGGVRRGQVHSVPDVEPGPDAAPAGTPVLQSGTFTDDNGGNCLCQRHTKIKDALKADHEMV